MNAASLAQVKMGTEALALCIAGVLCERDPSLLAAFRESVELLYRVLDDRGDHEAAAMVGERWLILHSSVPRTSRYKSPDDKTSYDCRGSCHP
jgi:hypothetical protein